MVGSTLAVRAAPVRPEGQLSDETVKYIKIAVVAAALLGVGMLIAGAYNWSQARTAIDIYKAETITWAGSSILKALIVGGCVWWCYNHVKGT
jgi:hypothetical protein